MHIIIMNRCTSPSIMFVLQCILSVLLLLLYNYYTASFMHHAFGFTPMSSNVNKVLKRESLGMRLNCV